MELNLNAFHCFQDAFRFCLKAEYFEFFGEFMWVFSPPKRPTLLATAFTLSESLDNPESSLDDYTITKNPLPLCKKD